jgi:hypothetical protein
MLRNRADLPTLHFFLFCIRRLFVHHDARHDAAHDAAFSVSEVSFLNKFAHQSQLFSSSQGHTLAVTKKSVQEDHQIDKQAYQG